MRMRACTADVPGTLTRSADSERTPRHNFTKSNGARIQLIVTDDIRKERSAQESLFGSVSDGTLYNALCSGSGGHNFALFFEPCGLTHRIIAHEIFHLTHRICEWVGAHFDHETFSLLNGALHQWVYSIVVDRVCPDGKDWEA